MKNDDDCIWYCIVFGVMEKKQPTTFYIMDYDCRVRGFGLDVTRILKLIIWVVVNKKDVISYLILFDCVTRQKKNGQKNNIIATICKVYKSIPFLFAFQIIWQNNHLRLNCLK